MSKKAKDNFEFAFKRDIPLGKFITQCHPWFPDLSFFELNFLIHEFLNRKETE